MASRLAIVFGFVFLTFAGTSSLHLRERRGKETCKDKDLQGCIGVLAIFMADPADIDVKMIDNRENLTKLCRQMEATLQCVANVTEDCEMEKMMRISIDTMAGVTGYICSEEGSKILLEEIDCLEQQTLEQHMDECVKDVTEQAYAGVDYCQIMEEVTACARDTAEDHCGRQAGDFVQRLMYELLNPISSELLDCHLQLRSARNLIRRLAFKKK